MNNTPEILEKIKIGLDVATYLLKTDRGIQASDLCDECVILLNNLDSDINGLDVSEVIFNAYYAISYTIKLIDIFYNAGISMKELADKYLRRSRFAEAKKLFESKALAIATEIGDRGGERVCYGNLGNVFLSLGEYQKAKEYHENALAIATEIGAREGEGTCYGNLGCVFESLGEYQKAKEYHEKALAIATEIGAREGEGRCYGNLGDVFLSLGEYQKAKEYCEKAIVIATQIGDRKGEGT
ncbi:unnamed protein product, partial [Pocillopora meandrina]